MKTFCRHRAILAMVVSATAAASALAQMQGFATYQGKRLPISTFHDDYLMVIENGSTYETRDLDVEVKPAKQFAEGHVEITSIEGDLDLLKAASVKDRTNPNAYRASYRATLTADRGLSDCYGLLTYVTEGSIGTRLVPIGHLGNGSAKSVEVKLKSHVSSFGSLHIFSEGLEVRTNQHPGAYDVIKYYADLVKDTKGVPAADLLKVEDTFPHQLSDDGRMLATIRKHDGKKIMIVYDLTSMKLICQTPVAGDEDTVQNLTWVTDHQVAYVAEAHEHSNYYSDWNLYLLEIRSGTAKKVRENIWAIVENLPDQPEVLELHSYYNGSTFMKYNVLTDHVYDYDQPATGSYLFDRQGTARLMIHFNETKRFYEFRPTPTSTWRDLDDFVKQPGLRFNLKSSDLLDRVADVHSVGPDGDTLYISTRLNSDRFELAAFSMSKGVIKQVIAQHPKYDLTTSDNGQARLLFAKKSSQLLGMIYEAQKPHVVWLHPLYAAVQKNIDATFPDHVNLPIDWSNDGSTFIYFSYSDQDPGTYYAFRPRKAELIPLLQLSDQLHGRKLGKTTPIEFTARDGAKIPGYVTRPPTTDGKPAPLIVRVHGGPTDRDDWVYDGENQFFATRGYIVLQVNYRGSSGYGAAFQRAGLRARLDTVVLDDIADGVRWLIAQHEVDPNRVAVMGGSFGGWATYMCLIKYPDLFRAGIAISAVSSWKMSLRDDRWLLGNEYKFLFWKALMEGQNYDQNAKYIEPYLRVSEIKQPVFIIHGHLDQIVHAAEADLMLDLLRKQNTPVEAKSFPMATHTYWPFGDRVERLNEIAGFLERYLPEPASPAATVAHQ